MKKEMDFVPSCKIEKWFHLWDKGDYYRKEKLTFSEYCQNELEKEKLEILRKEELKKKEKSKLADNIMELI
jgi:hypothetical protein